MSGLFESEVEEIKQIFSVIVNFIIANNKDVETTQYYLKLHAIDFLQTIENTYFLIDNNQKSEYIGLIKTFLEKLHNLHFQFSLSDDSESIEMLTFLKTISKNFGFSKSDNDNDLFSELENVINRIDKKEFVS